MTNKVIRLKLHLEGHEPRKVASQIGCSISYLYMVLNGRRKNIHIQNEVAKLLNEDPGKLWGNNYYPVWHKNHLLKQLEEISRQSATTAG